MIERWQAFRMGNKVCLRHTLRADDYRLICLAQPLVAEELVSFINRHRSDSENLSSLFELGERKSGY